MKKLFENEEIAICRNCKKEFIRRKTFRTGRIRTKVRGKKCVTCSKQCAKKLFKKNTNESVKKYGKRNN